MIPSQHLSQTVASIHVAKLGTQRSRYFFDGLFKCQMKQVGGSINMWTTFISPSGDLGIGLVWDNNRTGPDPHFGPTVEILFKLN